MRKNKLVESVFYYFLSLDPKHEYFVNNEKVDFIKDLDFIPSKLYYRINKLFYILQIVYLVKYNKLLFNSDKVFIAYEFGPVHQHIISNINNLLKNEKNAQIDLNDDIKDLCNKIYIVFSEYKDEELGEYTHNDLSWMLAYEKREFDNIIKNPINTIYKNLDYYKVSLKDTIEVLDNVKY